MLIFKKTLSTKDPEKARKQFEKQRAKYLKELEALRKKYKDSLIDLAIACKEPI